MRLARWIGDVVFAILIMAIIALGIARMTK